MEDHRKLPQVSSQLSLAIQGLRVLLKHNSPLLFIFNSIPSSKKGKSLPPKTQEPKDLIIKVLGTQNSGNSETRLRVPAYSSMTLAK